MANSPHRTALHRAFVTVQGDFGTRQVHYRRGGRGPVVLLLHQSPQSSREMEPLIAAWGHAFTLIAPDSPGYGFSEPLRFAAGRSAEATIDDFARAILEFVTALGVGRFGVYGFHTGASIGAALAEASPDRVAAVACNGFVVMTEPEREAILRDYLPPLVPRWDGGHLAWLWARVREQAIFFPWHDRRAATRLDFDMPPADGLHAGLLEFLAAGDHYHTAYHAAFCDRAERRLPAMRVPLLITAQARDPLAAQLDRIGPRSASVQVERSADTPEALARAFTHLAQHPGDDAPATPATLAAGPGRSDYRGVPGRQVRVLIAPGTGHQPGGRRTVLLLHPPGGSAAALRDLAAELAGHADVLAPDLPGHGASDPPPAASAPGGTLAATVVQLAEALASDLVAQPVTVVGIGHSAPVAIELAGRLGQGTAVALLEPPAWSAADIRDWLRVGLPGLVPVWSGGHLLEAWHMVRDSRLYAPWFRREHTAIRPGEPDLNDTRIQRDVGDVLRANGVWQALMRDVLEYQRRPGGTGASSTVELPGVPSSWAEVLRQTGGAHGASS